MTGDRCDFHFDYPWPHEDLDPGCQFTEETAFYDCGRKTYCRFHLPIEDEGGRETRKAKWSKAETEVKSFNAAIYGFIEIAAKSARPANLTGVVFPSYITFDKRKLPESLWYAARFEAGTSYHNTIFSDDARFVGATFLGNARFVGATFLGDAEFDGTTFSGLAELDGATFSGVAEFCDATFSGDAGFEGVTFLGDVRFNSTTFSDLAEFGGATFSDLAWFRDTTFWGDAGFVGVTFSGLAGFGGAVFSGDTRFDSATFSGDAWFRGVTFLGASEFGDATFSSDANFSWSGKDEAPPKNEDREKETTTSPSEPGVFYRLDFSGGYIEGVADFNNRSFKELANFSGRVFGRSPKFHGTSLHQGTKWRGTDFTDTKSDDAEQDYRTLRLAMEQIRDRPQEGMFFALEQRAVRHQAKWWQLRKWLSYGYDWTCDYGRSAGRPLAWLGGLSLFFVLFYLALSGAVFVDWLLVRELFVFTVQQVVKPFAIWGRSGDFLMPCFTNDLALIFKLLATLQSLLSLGLIALFILALRWQFRRG